MKYCMKKVLFDIASTQPSKSGKRHGGGKYGEEVFFEIVRKKMPVSCLIDSSKWLNPTVQDLLLYHDIETYDISKESLSSIISKNDIEIFYSPLPGDKIEKCNCKMIGTIHGMRSVELQYDKLMGAYKSTSAFERLKFLIKKYLPLLGYKHACAYFNEVLRHNNFTFVMVSQHSRNSLLSYFPQFANKEIPVFYSPATNNILIEEKKYNDKFYFLVSANRWEKNNLRAIIAIDRLISHGLISDIKVRITGLSSPNDIRYKIRNLECFDFIGYVDETELAQLYHDAYCLIYPSLNEGFGYPPIEAMKYGVPVIASPFTSISEICEGSVLYTNPLSIEEIMSRILMMETDDIHNKYSVLSISQYEKIRKIQDEDLDRLIDFIYK